MPEQDDMRFQVINLYDKEDRLVKVCSALSDTTRRRIIKLVHQSPLTINDIAWKLNIPVSNASYHVKALVEAGMLRYAVNTKKRGNEKLIALGSYVFTMNIGGATTTVYADEVHSFNVPIGSYTAFEVEPTCGIYNKDGVEIITDTPVAFYSPTRFNAGIIWFRAGYLEYSLPLTDYYRPQGGELKYYDKKTISSISFKFELCSETAQYNHDYKSDITFSVNGKEAATIVSGGDYGERRGRLNPPWLANVNTQYGLMYNVDIRFDGTYLNEKRVSDVCVDDLSLVDNNLLTFRIEVKKDARHVGGVNLFGHDFGDYPQDITVDITYQNSAPRKQAKDKADLFN